MMVIYTLSSALQNTANKSFLEFFRRVKEDTGGPVRSVVRSNKGKSKQPSYVFIAEREKYSFYNKYVFTERFN